VSARIPPTEAFEFYVGLGPDRSYQRVANEFGVSKRAITKLAARERWQQRVAELERQAREGAERKALESLEGMNLRHLKSLKIIQGKALEALRTMPLSTAMEAVRALDMAIRQERLIRGEPSDRTAISVEEVIRREYERLMLPAEDEDA
jgi:hypothetical protein